MHSVNVMRVKRCMQCPLAVHPSIEYYKQQYCTLFIGLLTADVTITQGQVG